MDHFIRDRAPTTTHQFICFLTRILQIPVILTTNFDPLIERAFEGEGISPRVYEVQGEGSIPSAKLLLSQPLSVVKLHGGAHKMQTGFDLDNPLSPAALASFTELYSQLHKQSKRPPLTIVLGYSGSDRRVMDIVTAQVAEWEPESNQKTQSDEESDCRILWITRDPWMPSLLESAIVTHPNVLQHGPYFAVKNPKKLPVHALRYRDGRLFLLETLQKLLRHFPIARSHYQAVNFVPHSVAGKDRSTENAGKFIGNWRLAMIHTPSGGGSSSTLVALSENLEKQEYRTIWIDLTEVAGVPALIDMVSERLTKLDGRLQSVRRPPLLRSIFEAHDQDAEPRFLYCSRQHEFRSCVQWLRLALRRGRYLLALDSLDEFPSEHPADPKHSQHNKIQRQLMSELILELAKRPDLLGDSRIAIALSSPLKKQFKDTKPDTNEILPDAFEDLVNQLKVWSARNKTVLIPDLTSATRDETDVALAFLEAKDGANIDGSSLSNYERTIASVVLLISCSARRIRSEVLLTRCVAEFLRRINVRGSQTWEFLSGIKLFRDCKTQQPTESFKDATAAFWREPGEEHQQLSHFSAGNDDENILQIIHKFSGHGAGEGRGIKLLKSERQWLYRTEGGYHWMHRDLRDTLYVLLKSDENSAALAMAHHVIALFCYDELYERSRDARAFLEYLFHRIAAIQLASELDQKTTALNWVTRLLISLHREKHALLARVRLPSFIWHLMQLKQVMENLCHSVDDQYKSAATDRLDDLLGLLSDFLIASGHPHPALELSIIRWHLHEDDGIRNIPNRPINHLRPGELEALTQRIQNVNLQRPGRIRFLSVLRDVAYSCHEPLLSAIPFPSFKSDANRASEGKRHDWVDGMEKWGNTSTREARIKLCQVTYQVLSSQEKSPQSEILKQWADHDEEMDFFGGLVRRSLEFKHLQSSASAWIGSSKVYLQHQKTALSHLEDFCYKNGKTIPAELKGEIGGEIALLRRSARRQRHECYRLCVSARIEASDWTATNLLNSQTHLEAFKNASWAKIRRYLADAESILNRNGGPADQQSMAITRLTQAELSIRRAELLRWLIQHSSNDIGVLARECEKSLSEAFSLLTTVEQLMNEGRGENRWRFFYLLTLARAHLLRGYLRCHDAKRSAISDLTWAARYLIAGLNNCGIWTDRYDILLWWWDCWKEVARVIFQMHHSESETEYRSYLLTTYAQLGIMWDHEGKPSRKDRELEMTGPHGF